MTAIYFESQLPWDNKQQGDSLFKAALIVLLCITAAFTFYVAITQLPEPTREARQKIPEQLARIIDIQQLEPQPPPIVEPDEKPEPIPEDIEPIEEVADTVLPPVETAVISEPAPEPIALSEETVRENARETAQSKGVLAFADTLASMREISSLNNLANTTQTQGAGEAQQTQRDLIASTTLTTSGGVTAGDVSTNIGAAGELEGHRTTEFSAVTAGEAALATQRAEATQQVIGSRHVDEIRRTLAESKGAVYSLYRRALRSDPTLEGKLTVKLVIEPDGSLSLVALIDSELDNTELVERLIRRIRAINFGQARVTRTELEYAYNFLPY